MEYYILQLSDILDEYYEDSWFEHMDYEYNCFMAERDRALIQTLIALYNKNVASFLGHGPARDLLRYFENVAYLNSSSLFAEGMGHLYCAVCQKYPENDTLKRALLTAISYEMISSDELFDDDMNDPLAAACREKSLSDYTAAAQVIREVTGEIFGNYDNFAARLRDYVERHGGVLYDNIFDAFLDEEYGACDWEMGEW
jgi:hypothetical protein